jgi:hypothetical protein
MYARFVCSSLLAWVVVGCTDGTGSKPSPPLPSPPPVAASLGSLQTAHQAYLEGNWTALGERVRDVLLDPGAGDLAKENAYALLDKAYEVQGGKLPSAIKLPRDFEFITYGTSRKMTPHGASFAVHLRGRMRDASHVAGVTVRSLPGGEKVLDKDAAKVTYDVSKDEPGFEDFVLQSSKLDALPADGVFTVRIAFDNAVPWEGWFIGHALESSASPELRSPSSSESLTDMNPLIAWPTFRSPQFAPFEKRILNIWVSHDTDPSVSWDFWTGDAGEINSVRIGAQEGAPKTKLIPGDYWFAVQASEQREFGPFRLARGSETAAPFHIVR